MATTKVSSSRNTVEDQTFDMFAIPYSDAFVFKGGRITLSTGIVLTRR